MKRYVLGFLTGVAVVIAAVGFAHTPCGNGGWQDGYIKSDPNCYQQPIADVNGGITYIIVCE